MRQILNQVQDDTKTELLHVSGYKEAVEMDLPFIYGAHYYWAPSPEKSFWADDLRRMAESGFNAVKFFAQWRWIHRKPDEFYFEDLDELMNLAAENSLSVTLNVLSDMGPAWIFKTFTDSHMVTASGMRLHPRAISCRPIGGYPGPCLNHPGAGAARDEFLRSLVERYVEHPAMGMWDIWNEPKSCVFLRMPHASTLLCYCHNCPAEISHLAPGTLQTHRQT